MDATTSEGQQNLPDDFKIKGAASRAACRHHEIQEVASKDAEARSGEVCTICLDTIEERAVAVPCNHLSFDFLCLVSWLQEQNSCPLCKAIVTEVQYDWRSPEEYACYRVPETKPTSNQATTTRWRYPWPRRPHVSGEAYARRVHAPVSEDLALDRRKHIYQSQLYSLHVGANRISSFQNFTPVDFANSPELQTRARMFVRRELKVFAFLQNTRGNNADFLLEYVVAILKTTDLKDADGKAEDLLCDFLGKGHARLFLHELEAWLRSPYGTLEDWDRHVQYADGCPGPKRLEGAGRQVPREG